MSSENASRSDPGDHWDDIGRAAEDFARRVARDAGRFAERMSGHAETFARDVSRDWREIFNVTRREFDDARRTFADADPRQVFADVRTVVAGLLDGVDELIERVFHDREPRSSRPSSEASSDARWEPMVSNREAICGECGGAIHAGDQCQLRRTPSTVELRCARCGPARSNG